MFTTRLCLCLLALFSLPCLFALNEGDLKDDAGQIVVHYAVEAPANMAPADTTDPAKQHGLFVCFHEHGGKAPDETHSVIESLKRLNLSGGYVVLGMKDGTAHGYSPVEDHERAVKLIGWAKKTYPINPRRVYLWGRGEGAKFVGEFGAEHADIIAAIISYSWGFQRTCDVKDPALDIPDFYMVLGLKDIPTHYKWVRETFALAKQHGYNVIYREAEGLGGPTKNPPTNDDAILWATSSRHKTMALSEQETALLETARADEAGAKILALIGGRQAERRIFKLFYGAAMDDKAKDEWVIAVTRAFSIANFGPKAVANLVDELKDSSAAVRKAIIEALGVQANWRNMPAQDALIKLATDKNGDVKERGLAVEAIGVAVKLQVKGSYQMCRSSKH